MKPQNKQNTQKGLLKTKRSKRIICLFSGMITVLVILWFFNVPWMKRLVIEMKYQFGFRWDSYHSAAGSLKTLKGMIEKYKKQGVIEFPVGNDPSIPNNGKYCGLFYELNNTGERLAIIGAAEAGADCRADGDTDQREDNGYYRIQHGCASANGRTVEFSLRSKQGYWFGLMKFYRNGDLNVPYNKSFSKHHFALVAFPDEYGSSGEYTYIINEEGVVYHKDMGENTGYIDTYPGPDPTDFGWEVTK